MQAPVMKRNAITSHEVGSTSRIAPLAAAATKADIINRRRGAMRSERPKIALTSVPQTNPTATLLVSNAAWSSDRANSNLSDGMIAVAENHKASAMTSHSDNTPMESHFRRFENCASDGPALILGYPIGAR
jgi:hypothetical protein